MKIAWSLFLLGVLAAPGCLLLPELEPDTKVAAPPPVAPPVRKAVPVNAERVSSTNAHQTADALWDELDRAAQDENQP